MDAGDSRSLGLAGHTASVCVQGLELKSIINNSPHGDASRVAPAPDDLIYVAHVPNGIDAADYIHTVLANARASASPPDNATIILPMEHAKASSCCGTPNQSAVVTCPAAPAGVKHVELDAYMYTHLSSSQVCTGRRPVLGLQQPK